MERTFGFYFVIIFVATTSWISAAANTVVAGERARFLREPHDLIVSAGTDVELPCSIESDERLMIRWARNGQPLRTAAPTSNGSLLLRNVQRRHEGIYQCGVLWLPYGLFLSRPGNLTIARIGNFTEEPQDLTVPVGGSARFQCSVADAAPQVSITWFRNDLPLVDGEIHRFRTLSSGILQIINVRPSDRGTYVCVASNIAGNITSRAAALATSSESVQPSSDEALKVIAAPTNVSISQGKTALFECLFESPEVVIWKRIDEKPIPSKADRIGSNLVISNVSPQDEGVYACVGMRGSESVVLVAQLFVDMSPVIKHAGEEKRERRGSLVRLSCDTHAEPVPQLTWYKDGERLRSYSRIKMHPEEEKPPDESRSPDPEKIAEKATYKRDLVISSFQQDDHGVYQCIATNRAGSASVVSVVVYDDQPLVAPQNFTAVSSPDNMNIQLSWQAHPLPSVNLYVVHYHESEDGTQNTMGVQATEACQDNVCRVDCCSPNTLEPHKNYTFWVDAILSRPTEHGTQFSDMSRFVNVTSGDGASLTVAPLTLQELPETTSVHLSWDPPPKDQLRGEVLEYRIEAKDDKGATITPTDSLLVPYFIREHTFNNLASNTVIFFRVIPRTRGGFPEKLPEDMYPWLRYKTRNGSIGAPAAPSILVHPLNVTSIFVQWAQRSTGGPLSNWLITASRPNDGSVVARSVIDGEKQSIILLGLTVDTLYQVTVTALNANGNEGLKTMKLVRTNAAAVTDLEPRTRHVVIPFPSVHCEPAGPGKLKVYWKTPYAEASSFKLRYSVVPDDNESLNVTAERKLIDTSASFILFEDLIPGRDYMFAASLENRDGHRSGFSDDLTCSVPLTKPPPPENVEAAFVNGSLYVSWAPPDQKSYGEILFFHVRYAVGNEENKRWHEITVNGTNSSVVLADIYTPSGLCYVSVSAENEVGRGSESPTKIASIDASSADKISSNPPTTVVFQTSYKEGIIIGVCIALICAIVCVLVLVLRSRRDRNGCIYRVMHGRRGAGPKPPTTNGCVPNGHNGVHRIELTEMQTLLPHLFENIECDSKGGAGGDIRSVSRGHFPMPSPITEFQNSTARTSQPQNEMLTISVHSPCGGDAEQREQSSDLSHSPATGSSLQSWSHTNGELSANGVRKNHLGGSASMPNLFDSGIGFDDLSTSQHHRNHHIHRFTNHHPYNGVYCLGNHAAHSPNTDVNDVLLPSSHGEHSANGDLVSNGYAGGGHGKFYWLRDFIVKQQQQNDPTRASTALGHTLSESRATSQCTC